MTVDLEVPEVGEAVTEVEIGKWLEEEGEGGAVRVGRRGGAATSAVGSERGLVVPVLRDADRLSSA